MKDYSNCLFFSRYRDLLILICSCVVIFMGFVFLYISFFVRFDFISSYNGFVKISDEYIISDNGPVRKVYLKFNLNDSDKIINNVLKLNFINRTTIFSYVKERFLWKN